MELKKKVLTLCVIHQGDKVLLAMKKRGFGVGRWNGFGDKVHPDESIEAAANREMKEEGGITAPLKKRAVMNFYFENQPEYLEVHLFSANQYEGTPVETEEMKPQWFQVSAIPFKEMWPDDIHWFPTFLAGKNFTGNFYFKDTNTLLRHEIKEV